MRKELPLNYIIKYIKYENARNSNINNIFIKTVRVFSDYIILCNILNYAFFNETRENLTGRSETELNKYIIA